MMTGCEENDNKITLDEKVDGHRLVYIYIHICIQHKRAILSIIDTRSIYIYIYLFDDDDDGAAAAAARLYLKSHPLMNRHGRFNSRV